MQDGTMKELDQEQCLRERCLALAVSLVTIPNSAGGDVFELADEMFDYVMNK